MTVQVINHRSTREVSVRMTYREFRALAMDSRYAEFWWRHHVDSGRSHYPATAQAILEEITERANTLGVLAEQKTGYGSGY